MTGDEESENGAGDLICKVLKAKSYIRTGDDSSASDGVIYFDDGREIQLEVTRTIMQDFAQAAKEAERVGHQVALSSGSGEWFALLSPQTKIKEFSSLPADAIAMFAKEHGLSLDLPNDLMCVSISGFNVSALSGKPSHIVILRFQIFAISSNGSGFISSHPDAIADFAASQISALNDEVVDSGRRSKFEKLDERAKEHRRDAHFAFVVQNTIDTGFLYALWETFQIHGVDTPQKAIELPSGVSCIWIIRGDYEVAFCFSSEVGWTRHAASE